MILFDIGYQRGLCTRKLIFLVIPVKSTPSSPACSSFRVLSALAQVEAPCVMKTAPAPFCVMDECNPVTKEASRVRVWNSPTHTHIESTLRNSCETRPPVDTLAGLGVSPTETFPRIHLGDKGENTHI